MKNYGLIIGVLAVAMCFTGCGDSKEETAATGFSEISTESTMSVNVVSEQSTTATTVSTTQKTTVKTTTAAKTTKKATSKTTSAATPSSGEKLLNIKEVYTRDGKTYITATYLKAENVYDDDGEFWTLELHETDGKSHTFAVSDEATIKYSPDLGNETTSIKTKDLESKLSSVMQYTDGVSYTAKISGDTVSSLEYYYVP